MKEKVSVKEGNPNDVERSVEQSFMRSWDCSQIENEPEEEIWRERDQIALQWDEEQNNGGGLGTKKDGRTFLAVGGDAKFESVVHESMSQGTGVKGFKDMKKVSRWSMEEMEEKPNTIFVKIITVLTRYRPIVLELI